MVTYNMANAEEIKVAITEAVHSGKWSGESLFSAEALYFPSDEVQGKSLEQSLQLMALMRRLGNFIGVLLFRESSLKLDDEEASGNKYSG